MHEKENTANHGTARHSTARHCMAGQNTARYRTALHRSVELAKLSAAGVLFGAISYCTSSWVWLAKKRNKNLSPHLLKANRCSHFLLELGAPEPGAPEPRAVEPGAPPPDLYSFGGGKHARC